MFQVSNSIRSFFLVVLAAAVVLPAPVSAQAAKPLTYKILGISVAGNKSAESAAIIANSGLKVGDEISVPGEQTRTAITRLWGLRIFSNIEIEAENIVGDGAYILIRVEENPRLERIEYTGLDAVSESDLQKKLSIVRGQIVSPQEINKIERTIKKAYEEEGYLQTDIKHEIEVSPDTSAHGKVILHINVDEGPDAHIGSIVFFGNKAFDASDLKGAMDDTHEKVWWKFWRGSKLDRKKYAEDKKKIVQFYKKNGYRDAELMSDSMSYDKNTNKLTLRLYVYEGPQYKVRNIVWEGNTVFRKEALSERLGIVHGEVYNAEKFDRNLRSNEDQSDVMSLYLDNGYLTASIEDEYIKVAPDSLDIILHVRERNQFRIAKVDIKGNTKTQERVIRRELYTRPGDYFSRSKIIRSIRQLSVLNYFNPEKIKPDTKFVDDKNVDVVYEVEEKSSDTFNMSVGYSGVLGFTGAIGLTFNNFSLREPFSGGGGQMLGFDWQFGGTNDYSNRTLSISFREPWLYDTPTSFGFSLYDSELRYLYNIRQTGGTISLGRRFKFPDDYFSGNWTFRVQRIDAQNYSAYSSYYRSGLTTQFSISQVIGRNSINNPIFPSDGSNFALSSEISGPPFLPGTAKYNKHLLTAEWYVPVFNNPKFALYLGSNFGGIFGYDSLENIPPIEFFTMGGTGLGLVNNTQLRGYEDRSVGPASLLGTVMLKHTVELRYNLSMNPIPIYFLTFAEAGNSWTNMRSADFMDLKRSAGFGARILVNPIGMLGFDYGYGFDDVAVKGKPDGWKFHFQFGKGF
ncbi:MAG TPA: outer membrane protein assembly factor BamA [Bacteroidota bacterium]|nr:outer membrane protein assembly factor BamA [Bacteroidota bacterium]